MTMSETKKQKAVLDEWHNRELPDNAFEDDPRAKSYDINGRVRNKANNNLPQVRWDLGEFPPND